MPSFLNAASGKSFVRDEDGAITAWALAWGLVFMVIGGLSIDAGNLWRTKSMLQATADAAALAGAIELDAGSDDDARDEAIRVADLNLPVGVLVDSDIASGAWYMESRTLNTAAALHDAVQVTTRRADSTANPLPTFLLKLVGFDRWNVAARATAQRFVPGCIKSGLIARGRVEVSSNNDFLNGICIHGQTGVKISSNNFFQDGVKVTMPDLSQLQIPNSGFDTNEGLEQALGEDWIDPKVVDHVGEIITALKNPASLRQPSYIDKTKTVINMTKSQFNSATSFTPGRVYNVTCGGNQQIDADVSLNQVVVVTDCRVNFAGGTSFTNAIIATSNTNTNSMSGNSSNRLGADDHCTPGGGAQLISAGSMHFAGSMEIYGSQLIAKGEISVAAQADGIEGVSMQTGGDIKLTSLSSFGLCNDDVDLQLFENYYRIVS